jgi:DNA-damage-inducible protein D
LAELRARRRRREDRLREGRPDSRPLADFLPTITIKAKDFANEVTHTQVKQYDLRDEPAVTSEHVRNNADVRRILTDRDIRPEALPRGEDVRKVQRRLKAEEQRLPRAGRAKR